MIKNGTGKGKRLMYCPKKYFVTAEMSKETYEKFLTKFQRKRKKFLILLGVACEQFRAGKRSEKLVDFFSKVVTGRLAGLSNSMKIFKTYIPIVSKMRHF